MPLVQMVFILIAVAVLMWALNKYGAAFMDAQILKIINIVVIVAVVLWILSVFGLWDYVGGIHVGKP